MPSHFVNILLVEDNPGDARLTQEALRQGSIPHRLHIADTGYIAIDMLQGMDANVTIPAPDLILLDLNLPGKDGREVLQEIKADPRLRRIPVIILTTSNDEGDILTSYDLHANCYIVKPMDMQSFSKVIRQVEEFWFSIAKLPST